MGAAGAIEAIASIKAVEENIVPPTINSVDIGPDFREMFNLALNKAQLKTVTYAMNNTFGFGGHIATTIFKK
jgi:3-oxoacyl-[acyl-carrier-protein] synthase II